MATAIRRAVYGNLRRALAAAALLAVVAAGLPTPAGAHPHIWVTVRATVLFEKGAAVGIRHAWTFDEYYTAMAIDGLDKNGDGKYSRDELAELAQVNMDGLKEFAYFTDVHAGKTAIKLAAPRDFYLEHAFETPDGKAAATPAAPGVAAPPAQAPAADAAAAAPGGQSGADRITEAAQKPAGHLTLHFTLPFDKPVPVAASDLTLTIADPTYFIAFEPAPDHAMTLGRGAPAACRAIAPPTEAADTNPAQPTGPMASQPAAPTINFVSAPDWRVTCGAKK